ncbi:ABC transporter substrate-binding protein [Enterovirga aerilata]|uniref:ABC transporter substrate-binding protein n=1 Tax=Enterovirga aerilata TaxID=2730920 RepID=A0A849I8F5_9HYPH|nr:ABC transporter substrate-binding protein [Enterovirga sp. DB1703]NNM72575.1 ABC transporter substrate-binding protein [Enterovirga sp. DB1703]
MLNRRSLLQTGAALAVAGPARGAELERVRVSIIPINDVTPLFVAIERGFFRNEGLLVDTSPSAGGATGIPGLVAGSYDIAYGNVVSTLLAAQQGIELRVIAPGTKIQEARNDHSAIVVRRESGIRSGKDLEGKVVGVNTRNNVIWLYARAWIKATGGNPDRVTYKEIPHPQMEDAIRQKQVDAGYMVVPYVTLATAKPEFEKIAHPYSAVQLGVDVGQYLATASFVQSKPETVAKFVRALRRGIEWYNANLTNPDLLPIISGFTKIEVPLLKTLTLPPAPLVVEPAQMERTTQLMIEHRLLRKPVDVKALVAPMAL